MKHLVVDLDSTLCDHWRRIARNSRDGEILPKAFSKTEIMFDHPLPGALRALTRFKRDGYHITILTARDFANAEKITKAWLQIHRLPVDHTIFVHCMGDKLVVLRQQQPTLFVDDFMVDQEKPIPRFMSHVYEAIRGMGIPVEPFRNNWDEIVGRHLR